MSDIPFISADQKVAELSVRVIILAVILTILLAMSNAYLALKLGILTSASIPAAIISMGILRFFKHATLLENNAVQTAASAGEAVAGGIVYTIPALIIIGYWHSFDYMTNVLIAACGGILGVLFSIPLRRILVHEPMLRFPEGRAIAEVLKSTREQAEVIHIVLGGVIGGLIELFQIGFKVIANSWSHWVVVKRSLFGMGVGFSATMIGAGYLVGQDMAISIFLGALIAWIIAIPIVSQFYPEFITQYAPAEAATHLWNSEMRYLGIGAMLFAGVWTFINLIKPMLNSIAMSLRAFRGEGLVRQMLPRTDRDIPLLYLLIGIGCISCILFLLFQSMFPIEQLGLNGKGASSVVFFAVVYVLIVGFLFSVITAYFSGMVGVTASPGSSVVIAGMLFAAWLLLIVINKILPLPLTEVQIQAAEAITVVIGSVVTGIAAIANDNTQDLKVGQLVGATPWKQQVMLLLGVMISALVIPPVMQLLFDVYGIAGVMPRPGMDVSHSLPAPTAALMAAITEAVFRNSLPWTMMLCGAFIILMIIVLNRVLRLKRVLNLSILGIAIGMYLPLSSSVPLFLGGMMAFLVKQRLKRMNTTHEESARRNQKGTLIACGLVAGSALMDVILALPFSLAQNPNVLQIVGASWDQGAVILGIFTVIALGLWIRARVCS